MAIPVEAVARMLLIVNARSGDYEDGFCGMSKFDAKTLRKLSGRRKLTSDFYAELEDAFADLGWHFGPVFGEEDTFYIFIDDFMEDWDDFDADVAADLVRLWDGKLGEDEAMEKVEEEYEKLYGVEEED